MHQGVLMQCYAWLQLTVAGVHTEGQKTRGTSSSVLLYRPPCLFWFQAASHPSAPSHSSLTLSCTLDFNMTQSSAYALKVKCVDKLL